MYLLLRGQFFKKQLGQSLPPLLYLCSWSFLGSVPAVPPFILLPGCWSPWTTSSVKKPPYIELTPGRILHSSGSPCLHSYGSDFVWSHSLLIFPSEHHLLIYQLCLSRAKPTLCPVLLLIVWQPWGSIRSEPSGPTVQSQSGQASPASDWMMQSVGVGPPCGVQDSKMHLLFFSSVVSVAANANDHTHRGLKQWE